MDPLITEIEAPVSVIAEFRNGFKVHAALCAVRQEKVNAACRSLESRLMDGIGQLKYSIDADLYWLARHKYGAGCWSDKSFVRDCEKKGMIQAVRGRSTKIISQGRGEMTHATNRNNGGLIQ